MNLTEELDRLIKEPMRGEDIVHDRVFWRLFEVAQEMAKRIEALEQRETARLRRSIAVDDNATFYDYVQG